MKQRIFSMLLAAIMVFTSVDITVFAQTTNEAETEVTTETESAVEEVSEEEETDTTSTNEFEEEVDEDPETKLPEIPEEVPPVISGNTEDKDENNLESPSVESEIDDGDENAVEGEDVIIQEELQPMLSEVGTYAATTIIASGECGDNLTWTLDNEGVLTISGTGDMWDRMSTKDTSWFEYKDQMTTLVIEDGITSIGTYAFSNCSGFTGNLTIPDSVTSIGYYAFSNCSGFTGDLTIGNSVTSIGTYAFSNCSGFTGELTIPDGVTKIGNNVFSNCSGFTGELTIPDSVINIGDFAFNRCSGFTGDLTIGNSVTSIGTSAFYECSGFTGNLTIGNSVTSIGNSAFYRCSGFTGNLTIGNSVTSIGNNAFNGCSGFIGDLIIPDSVISIGTSAFSNCSGFTGNLTIPDSVTSIGMYAFHRCSGFTGELTISDSVISIGEGAFRDCSGFTGNLTIGNSVTNIGEQAFYCCEGFTGDLTIPDSVTSIGNSAFERCSGFTGNLTIGNGVTSIGDEAFIYCRGFTGNLTIGNSVTSIGMDAFHSCRGFTGSLTIPDSVTDIGVNAFYDCSGFTGKLTIGNSVTSIGDYTFYRCEGFTGELIIPDSVTSIGKASFYNCSGFTGELTISDSLTSIGEGAFYNCNSFTGELTIPDGVTSIGRVAFYGCSGFTGELIIPDSVTGIGESAFYNCKGFTGKLTIGKSVASIEKQAFYGCSGLTGDLIIPDSVTSIGNNAFERCSGFTGKLTIGNSVISIGDEAFIYCSGFTGNLTIGNSVTSIGNSSFNRCSGFTGDLTIPNSVTSIGNAAFYMCEGFTGKLTIGNSVARIGTYAFCNCYGLTGDLIIPDSVTSISEGTFFYCSGFTGELIIPSSVTSIGKEAFYDCRGFTGNLIIPNSVTSIGKSAFYNCSGFTGELIIPNSVTSMGEGPFLSCSNIEKVIIQYGVEKIEANAFKGCSSLVSAIIPGSVSYIGQDAFASCNSGLVIYGVSGTYAEAYAQENAITFVNNNVPTTGLKVSPENPVIVMGYSKQMTVSVTPSDSTEAIVWESSDSSVATVTQRGLITGVNSGTCQITVTVGNISEQFTVTVLQPVTAIEVSPTTASLEAGETVQLSAQIYPTNASNKEYIWSSENEAIATVDESGLVKAISKGTVDIYAIAKDGSGQKACCSVTVKSSINIVTGIDGFESPHPYKNDSSEIWLYKDEDASTVILRFSEDTEIENNSDYIYILDEENNQVGKYTGTALAGKEITVNGTTAKVKLVSDQSGAEYGFKVIEVRSFAVEKPLEAITIDEERLELGVGLTKQLQVSYLPGDTTDSRLIIWSSSNPAVATVDKNGTIQAVGYGETIIEAKSAINEELKDTCTVLVNQCEIQFDSMGGNSIEPVLCGRNKCYDFSAIVPEKENYAFVGWYKDREYRELWTDNDIVTSNMTLYAKWQEAKEGLWILPIADQIYTGRGIKPEVKVYEGVTRLQEKTDYTISYKNNIEVCDSTDAQRAPIVVVRGKGNYAGVLSEKFSILPKDIENEDIIIASRASKYNGRIQKKIPTVSWNEKRLRYKLDFMVEYPDSEIIDNAYKEPGTYEILVRGIGNYSGEKVITFTITNNELISKAYVEAIKDQDYTGSAIEPLLKIRYGNNDLVKGKDYSVTYKNNTQIGTATAVITGIGNFSGEKIVSFKIVGTGINQAVVTGIPESLEYIGEPITFNVDTVERMPKLTILRDKTMVDLEEGKDYTISYRKNKDQGIAIVQFVGMGAYSGKLTKTFRIHAYDISKDKLQQISVHLENSSFEYSKFGIRPKPIVMFGKDILTEGKDYTLSYRNNYKVNDGSNLESAPTVIVKGKGNFTGTEELSFVITGDNPNLLMCKEDKSLNCYGATYESETVTNTEDNSEITKPKDYEKDSNNDDKDNLTTVENSYRTIISGGEEKEITLHDNNTDSVKQDVITEEKTLYEGIQAVRFTIKSNLLAWWENILNMLFRLRASL